MPWEYVIPAVAALLVVNLFVSRPDVRRHGDEAAIRLRGTGTVRFRVGDIDGIEDIGRTSRLAGWGMHGWRGRWTLNCRSSPATRITFQPPAAGRVLGFPVKVRVLDVAPLAATDLRRLLDVEA